MASDRAGQHQVVPDAPEELTLEDFTAWGTTKGLTSAMLAERWLVASFAERWLARYRLPLVVADRSDVEAWCASADGRILGEEGLEAIRTFCRYAVDRGWRSEKPVWSAEAEDAQILNMQTHRSQRVG